MEPVAGPALRGKKEIRRHDDNFFRSAIISCHGN
jgi:hypothetical protein